MAEERTPMHEALKCIQQGQIDERLRLTVQALIQPGIDLLGALSQPPPMLLNALRAGGLMRETVLQSDRRNLEAALRPVIPVLQEAVGAGYVSHLSDWSAAEFVKAAREMGDRLAREDGLEPALLRPVPSRAFCVNHYSAVWQLSDHFGQRPRLPRDQLTKTAQTFVTLVHHSVRLACPDWLPQLPSPPAGILKVRVASDKKDAESNSTPSTSTAAGPSGASPGDGSVKDKSKSKKDPKRHARPSVPMRGKEETPMARALDCIQKGEIDERLRLVVKSLIKPGVALCGELCKPSLERLLMMSCGGARREAAIQSDAEELRDVLRPLIPVLQGALTEDYLVPLSDAAQGNFLATARQLGDRLDKGAGADPDLLRPLPSHFFFTNHCYAVTMLTEKCHRRPRLSREQVTQAAKLFVTLAWFSVGVVFPEWDGLLKTPGPYAVSEGIQGGPDQSQRDSSSPAAVAQEAQWSKGPVSQEKEKKGKEPKSHKSSSATQDFLSERFGAEDPFDLTQLDCLAQIHPHFPPILKCLIGARMEESVEMEDGPGLSPGLTDREILIAEETVRPRRFVKTLIPVIKGAHKLGIPEISAEAVAKMLAETEKMGRAHALADGLDPELMTLMPTWDFGHRYGTFVSNLERAFDARPRHSLEELHREAVVFVAWIRVIAGLLHPEVAEQLRTPGPFVVLNSSGPKAGPSDAKSSKSLVTKDKSKNRENPKSQEASKGGQEVEGDKSPPMVMPDKGLPLPAPRTTTKSTAQQPPAKSSSAFSGLNKGFLDRRKVGVQTPAEWRWEPPAARQGAATQTEEAKRKSRGVQAEAGAAVHSKASQAQPKVRATVVQTSAAKLSEEASQTEPPPRPEGRDEAAQTEALPSPREERLQRDEREEEWLRGSGFRSAYSEQAFRLGQLAESLRKQRLGKK